MSRTRWLLFHGAMIAINIVILIAVSRHCHAGTVESSTGINTSPLAPFDPFTINTPKATVTCPGVGPALCVPGRQGKDALKAFDAWPTVPLLRDALKKAQDAQAASERAAVDERRARVAREAEMVAVRAALDAEKQRADSLSKALWWRKLLYVVVPAVALGAGVAIGRAVR